MKRGGAVLGPVVRSNRSVVAVHVRAGLVHRHRLDVPAVTVGWRHSGFAVHATAVVGLCRAAGCASRGDGQVYGAPTAGATAADDEHGGDANTGGDDTGDNDDHRNRDSFPPARKAQCRRFEASGIKMECHNAINTKQAQTTDMRSQGAEGHTKGYGKSQLLKQR